MRGPIRLRGWMVVAAVVGILLAANNWFGPFALGGRPLTSIAVLDANAIPASQVRAQVSVAFDPIADRRNTLSDGSLVGSEFVSRLESELLGPTRALARETGGGTSVRAAYVIRAADTIGPREVYLYGTLYYRVWGENGDTGNGGRMVRMLVNPLACPERLVTRVEIDSHGTPGGPGVGTAVDGRYPRWVDDAFGVHYDEMKRLIGE
jgi:hypothetical protein